MSRVRCTCDRTRAVCCTRPGAAGRYSCAQTLKGAPEVKPRHRSVIRNVGQLGRVLQSGGKGPGSLRRVFASPSGRMIGDEYRFDPGRYAASFPAACGGVAVDWAEGNSQAVAGVLAGRG